jgi:hypothetical protein
MFRTSQLRLKIEQILDKQQRAEPLSLDQISRLVECGQQISYIHNQMAALACMLKMNQFQFTADGDRNATPYPTNADWFNSMDT